MVQSHYPILPTSLTLPICGGRLQGLLQSKRSTFLPKGCPAVRYYGYELFPWEFLCVYRFPRCVQGWRLRYLRVRLFRRLLYLWVLSIRGPWYLRSMGACQVSHHGILSIHPSLLVEAMLALRVGPNSLPIGGLQGRQFQTVL